MPQKEPFSARTRNGSGLKTSCLRRNDAGNASGMVLMGLNAKNRRHFTEESCELPTGAFVVNLEIRLK